MAQSYTDFYNFIKLNRIGNFNLFSSKVSSLTNKQKGDYFEIISKYIFIICPEIQDRTKDIWLYSEIPQEIKQKLNLPDKDKGIDILLRDRADRFLAIQCKYRTDVNESLTWDLLSTFAGMTFGVATGIYKGILITNSFNIADEIFNNEKFECIHGEFWNGLRADFFRNVIRKISGGKISYPVLKPYNYQDAIVSSAVEYFNNDDNKLSNVGDSSDSEDSDQEDPDSEDLEDPDSEDPESESVLQEPQKQSSNSIITSVTIADDPEDPDSEDSDPESEDSEEPADSENSDDSKESADSEESEYSKIDKGKEKVPNEKPEYDSINGILDVACGSGKTICSYWISSKLNAKKIIILVPSLHLLAQFIKQWREQDIATSEKIRQTLMIGSRVDQDIIKFGYLDLTTEKSTIDEFIKKNQEFIIISTYQSSEQLRDSINESGVVIDLAIFDEAHKTVGLSNNKKHRLFSLFLDLSLTINRRLFMTATPKIFKNSVTAKNADIAMDDDNYGAVSMTDLKTYGKIIYSYKFYDAIQDHAITNYDIIISEVINDQIKILIENDSYVFDPCLSKKERASTVFKAISVANAVMTNNCKHILTYHRSIDNSASFQKFLNDNKEKLGLTGFYIDHVNGSMKSGQINSVKNKMRNTEIKYIICSAKIFNEGVDFPLIDSVAFVDHRSSKIDIIQCCGRCLRKSPGKEMSHIIIPAIITNREKDLEPVDDNSDNLLTILRALKSENGVDINFAEYKVSDSGSNGNDACIQKGKISVGSLKVNVANVNVGGSVKVSGIKIDLDQWKEAIRAFNIELIDTVDPWETNYNKLKEFLSKNNGKYPSYASKDNLTKKLGSWIVTQRQHYKKGELSKERTDKLNSLPGWDYENVFNKMWEFNYNKLREYLSKNNGKYPTERSEKPPYKKLGPWIVTQRQLYKKGELSKERTDKLNSLPGWDYENVFNKMWEFNYNKLKDFLVKNNDEYPVSCSKDISIKKLGLWIQRQRLNYRKKILSKDRIDKLDLLPGWVFEDILDKMWEANYNKLKDLLSKNKGKYPTEYNKDTPQKMRKWAGSQRENYKKGVLSKERIGKLNLLSGWVFDMDQVWGENYKELQLYLSKNNGKYPTQHAKDTNTKKLGRWINNQRTNYKKGKLSKERIDKLTMLPNLEFVLVDTSTIKRCPWDQWYSEVKEFLSKNNGRYPSSMSKDSAIKKLGMWIGTQRRTYKENKLSKERIDKLNLLSGWVFDMDQVWGENYKELQLYLSKNNGKYPTQYAKDTNTKKLGIWVGHQRTNYKKGVLSKEKQDKLNQLPDWNW